MAESVTIARPYAQAVFRLARESNSLAAWSDRLQRLATIAHGDGVCTTHVPRPVQPADHPNRKAVS